MINLIHVAKCGSDGNAGELSAPYLTISRAAGVATAGDIIVVHAGTYREYVAPPRGGTSDAERIVYRANPGDEVYVKGSEAISSWTHIDGEVWEAQLDNTLFGDYNPYALNVDGDFQTYGQWHHRGEVYIDNISLNECRSRAAVEAEVYTWFAYVGAETTIIAANFAALDPNERQTEVNVRELLFFPTAMDIDYITIDGLRFLHAAPNWQAPNIGAGDPHPQTQVGAIGSNMGKHWIIENCEVSFSKTAGIMMGETFDIFDQHENIETFGDHIIRNNYISRCGEYGIAGQKGMSRSLVCGNLIEDINYKNEFGGHETAGIKIWNCSDVRIERNLIRRTYGDVHGYGIWIDCSNQGTRSSGNLVYDTIIEPIYIEANLGPTLVDNNILVGSRANRGLKSDSDGSILAHNLFVDHAFDYAIQRPPPGRTVYAMEPHTLVITWRYHVRNVQNKVYNNIFSGPPRYKNISAFEGSGDVISHNVYMGGAEARAEDRNAATTSFDVDLALTSQIQGVEMHFAVDSTPFAIEAPFVNAELIGTIPSVNQSIEDKWGNPLVVDVDFRGNKRKRAHPVVGPLEDLVAGDNAISWSISTSPTKVLSGQDQYALVVRTDGEGTCSIVRGDFTVGSRISIHPIAAEGWSFSRWSGDVDSATPVLEVSVVSDMAITAIFAKNT